MKALTYTAQGTFELTEKPTPNCRGNRRHCQSDTGQHLLVRPAHTAWKCAAGYARITVGHEMVGIVEATGKAVANVKPGDRVAVNVETFCGECFYCRRSFVNNCINGGWQLMPY